MISKVKTVAFMGMNPIEVTVEAQISPGIASFCIVGLPDKAVAEAKERVRSTLFSLGIGFPAKKLVINMAPADIPKTGSHYDLPIALAILASMEVIDLNNIENFFALGELGLDGRLNYVSGAICAAMFANQCDAALICPQVCAKEARWSGNNAILAADNMHQLIQYINGKIQLQNINLDIANVEIEKFDKDMADVKGQFLAKRALEIAASGRHNVLMIGPPGSGKSMLASRIHTILPRLSPHEALETTCVYSLAGMLPSDGLIINPPYRHPHHSASLVSMVGGGSNAKPGELSLAHNGVLFLDELPEFQRQTIEALRQPLEDASITISRAKEHITYPANIQLIAAMNPCKCGYYGCIDKQCSKVPKCAIDYRNKISGPILDRFDIIIYVQNLHNIELLENNSQVSSATIRERVSTVHDIQINRAKKYGIMQNQLNSKISNKYLESIAILSDEAKQLLHKTLESNNISARSFHRILRVARTIADMRSSVKIEEIDLSEAIQFKLKKLE